jgi:hypothetical protein
MTNEMLFLSVNKYENPHRIMVHEGNYAFNAKHPYAYINNMPEHQFEMAYDDAIYYFRSRVMTACNLYGFDTYSMEGRSEGWVTPHYKGKPVSAVIDDYMTFEEYVLEDRVASLFIIIEEIFAAIKRILRYSKTYEEFTTNIERYTSL